MGPGAPQIPCLLYPPSYTPAPGALLSEQQPCPGSPPSLFRPAAAGASAPPQLLGALASAQSLWPAPQRAVEGWEESAVRGPALEAAASTT